MKTNENNFANQQITKNSFPVLNMTCASCAVNIQSALKKTNGVLNASVNFANATAFIEYLPEKINSAKLKESVQTIGYDLIIEEPENKEESIEKLHEKNSRKLKFKTIGAVLFSLPVVIFGMILMNHPHANHIMWIFTTPVLFWFGKDFFINAYKHAKKLSANMDTLVAISTGTAYIFSLYNMIFHKYLLEKGIHAHVHFEAASVVIAFILLGKLLEEKAKGKTSSVLKKLIGLQPKIVTIILEDNTYKDISISNVKIGDKILVKPGEKIAVDGSITIGNSFVDESMISGEPIPVEKQPGSKVFSGTINQKGSFQFITEKVGENTMLAQIIKMVQDAQGSKAPVQKLADKIAGIFVPIVVGIAIISFIIWIKFGGENSFAQGLQAFVTVLVIACPCALGLATPTAIMVGIGKGAENGILIKNAESLERGKKVDVVVLDKTGTITEGRPEVTNIFWTTENNHYKKILACIERQSEHPLAEAIVNYLSVSDDVHIHSFKSITGLGSKAMVNDKNYFIGNKKLMIANNITIPVPLLKIATEWSSDAKTVVFFSDNSVVLAIIALADKIKTNSTQAIKKLQDSGIDVYMLTGDNENTAKAISKQVGIKNYQSEVMPSQKYYFIKKLQEQGKIVAMVGDGINDSNSLAQANISIAMGQGSDIAMDVAQMVIISSDLLKIPIALKLSSLTVKTIKQNLFWAFIYNIIGIPVAAGILYPIAGFLLNPMIAGAAMALSSVSVVGNSLLLKMKKI